MKSNKAPNKIQKFHTLQRKYLSIPYLLFLFLFILVPIVIIICYAFSYEYVDPVSGKTFMTISGQALVNFFTDWSKWNVLLVSLYIATLTTVICLLIGFPLAYFLANKKYNKNAVLVTLFIAPMWINFVLRTGATRDLLTWMGINGGNYPYLATMIGMVQNYLPFVILPLYTTMTKLDKNQVEAASDLGASPMQVFFKNIIPQAMPGIVSACLMTFMPTMSSYVISDVLSEGKITLIGNYIELEFTNKAWNDGSFMALIMLVFIAIGMVISQRSDKKQEKEGGQW